MPSRAIGIFRHEMFHAIVGRIRHSLPHTQAGLRNANGKVGEPEVQHGFPKKPLVRKPDTAVPVASRTEIGRGLVNGRDAYVHPEISRGKESLQNSFFLFSGTNARI